VSDADHAIVDALWAKVTEDFRAPGPHQAFLEHCRRSDLLAEAARRYREHRDQLEVGDEAGKAEANERLRAIALLAVAQLAERRSAPRKNRWRPALTLIMALITLAAMVGLVKALLL
jgi:hypothetical protein